MNKEQELINELKNMILAAVDDISLMTDQKQDCKRLAAQLGKVNKLSDKISEELSMSLEYEQFKELNESLDRFKSEVIAERKKLEAYLLSPAKSQSSGRKRIFEPISIEILKSIDVCEVNDISLEWLRSFLHPKGEIYSHMKEFYIYTEAVSLPVPTNDINGKKWLFKLKETLQRSLFSDDKVVKKNDAHFIKERDDFYQAIRSSNDEIYECFKLKRNKKKKIDE